MANLAGLILTTSAVIFIVLAIARSSSGSKQHRQRSGKKANSKGDKILLEYGSGDDHFENDDDDIGGSGGDRLASMSKCHREQMRARERKGQHKYEPQCTETGEFSSKQCNAVMNSCWCVDSNGVEIPSTRKREPDDVHCNTPERKKPVRPSTPGPRGLKINQPSVRTTSSSVVRGDNDIISIDTKTQQNSAQRESNVEVISSHESSEYDMKSGVSESRFSDSVFNRPGILAVIIGGAVIGLLVSVTLVMFIVYRMRKKDEGSYALDEPKTSPTIGYTKTRDREFFA